MKKPIFTLIALSYCSWAFGQSADRQVTGSGGASFTGPSLSVDYTIGESVTATGVAGTFTLSQGFQQNSDNPSSVKEVLRDVSYRLYPNPAQELITLSVSGNAVFDLRVSLCNVSGQTVFADAHAKTVQQQYSRDIPLNALPAGVYFVNLYDGRQQLLKSIRFVKQ